MMSTDIERSNSEPEERLVEYKGKKIDLRKVDIDAKTGEPKAKKKKSERKVYKVHKYKKSATSKAARSAQGKGKKRK